MDKSNVLIKPEGFFGTRYDPHSVRIITYQELNIDMATISSLKCSEYKA